jgi:hypothetical protein
MGSVEVVVVVIVFVIVGGEWRGVARCLFGLLLEEGDKVVAVLWLLETAESHLGAGDVFLGVLEVLELRCC